jgi:hypothetical protein
MDYNLLSTPLSNLFAEECMALSYNDLIERCESAFTSIKVTEDQAKHIESATRYVKSIMVISSFGERTNLLFLERWSIFEGNYGQSYW